MGASKHRRSAWPLIAAACTISAAALLGAGNLYLHLGPARLLLAPMIGVIEPCILPQPSALAVPAGLASTCDGPAGSAAALIESTLEELRPRQSDGVYELGYTLAVPLLKLFKPAADGWSIDEAMVARLVRTIQDSPRPAIVYLFSTHFGVDAPIEQALAADPDNLSTTAAGTLPTDSYYGAPIFNWSFARTDTGITRRRVEAVRAVTAEICRLQPHQRSRIRGVTLLGELHHQFPDFHAGMGFGGRYLVSDYSEASKSGFRTHLERKYQTIARFNEAMGTRWNAFTEIEPPSKDIRKEALRDFTEHIDAYAHGILPVAGWGHWPELPNGQKPELDVFLDGKPAGRARTQLSRQDVLQALPALGHADTGWRFDLDFSRLAAGIHRIDLFLAGKTGPLKLLGSRQVAVVDRQQSTPRSIAQQPLPAYEPYIGPGQFHVDLPADQSSYFYNPLTVEWHAFRGQQVVDYLQFFNRIVGESCLQETRRYTHQIVPFSNPGWDATKFAIDASLRPMPDLQLGVSLYGDTTYGTSFTNWLSAQGRRIYGVTEFHPLKPMGESELAAVFSRHADAGAQFISFFLEPHWNGVLVPRGHNIFSFDAANPKFGSDTLYRSAQAAITGQPGAARTAGAGGNKP